MCLFYFLKPACGSHMKTHVNLATYKLSGITAQTWNQSSGVVPLLDVFNTPQCLWRLASPLALMHPVTAVQQLGAVSEERYLGADSQIGDCMLLSWEEPSNIMTFFPWHSTTVTRETLEPGAAWILSIWATGHDVPRHPFHFIFDTPENWGSKKLWTKSACTQSQ